MTDYLPVPFDAKALTEPAKLLIEKISNAIGILYEPTRIREKAEAEADARRIAAISDVDVLVIRKEGELRIAAMEERALRRMIYEEARHQENIEAIAGKALGLLQHDDAQQESKTEEKKAPPSDDWMMFFINNCKIVSDEQMQALWAKVLAGEFKNTGRFSKQTISALSTLDPFDAEMVNHLASYSWEIGGETVPLVFDLDEYPYRITGMSSRILNDLEALGLIRYGSRTGYTLKLGATAANIKIKHQGKVFTITTPEKELPIGTVLLTRPGRQLLSICHPEPINNFEDFVIGYWRTKGIVVEPGEHGQIELLP